MTSSSVPSRSPRLGATVLFCAFVLIVGITPVAIGFRLLPASEDIGNASGVFLGFTVAQLSSPEPSLVITSLRSGSEAEQKGVAVGDRLLAIDRKPVDTVRSAETLLRRDTQDPIALQLVHNHQPIDISLSRDKERVHGP